MTYNKSRFKSFFFVVLISAMCLLLSACHGLTDSRADATITAANCWICSIYGSGFMIANGLVNDAITTTISVSKTILALGLAFILLFRIGSMMLFVSEKDMAKILKDTGFIFLKGMMVAILISKADLFLEFIRDVVIFPIGQFFLIISNAVLDSMPESSRYFGGIAGITPNMNHFIGQSGVFDAKTSIFGDLGIQVQYIVARIYGALNSGFVFVDHVFVIGGLFPWIIGLVMWWQLINLIIIFPFAFLDAFIWLAFYVVFSPICLVLWVFPATSKYLKVIFPAQLLTPFLNILFGCIISILLVSLLQLYSDLALNGMFRATTQNSNSWVAESASAGRPPILILLMVFMIVRKLALEIAEFTSKFGGESSDNSFFTLMNKAVNIAKKGLMIGAKLALGAVTGGAATAAFKVADTAVAAAKTVTPKSDGKGQGSA